MGGIKRSPQCFRDIKKATVHAEIHEMIAFLQLLRHRNTR